jgi:hypothetical protein
MVSGLGSGAARAPQPLPTAPDAGRNAASAPFEFALAFELRNQKLAAAASPAIGTLGGAAGFHLRMVQVETVNAHGVTRGGATLAARAA